MRITIDRNKDTGTPAFDADLDQVNVILGVNGSGKSKLLRSMGEANGQYPEFEPVLVMGGRSFPNLFTNGFSRTSQAHIFNNLEQTLTSLRGARLNNIEDRIWSGYAALKALDITNQEKRVEVLEEWEKQGGHLPMPPKEPSPLNQWIKLFNSAFSQFEMRDTGEFLKIFHKDSTEYTPNGLSSGEKQILALLLDIATLSKGRCLFLIDEPELNLHPTLADQLWRTLEDQFNDSIFVYATHSLQFAARPEIQRRFILHNQEGAREITSIYENVGELKAYLGAIPGVIKADRFLLVEGELSSFDYPFYEWICDGLGVEVVPVGSRFDVISAVSRIGIWQMLSTAAVLAGVIDSDFQPNNPKKSILQLMFHEAESYLCHPDIIAALSANTKKGSLTKPGALKILIEEAKSKLFRIVANRVSGQCFENLTVSIRDTDIVKASNERDLLELILNTSTSQLERASERLDKARLTEVFNGEVKRCVDAIEKEDISELLTLFEGKKPLKKFQSLFGFRSSRLMLTAVRQHLNVDAFQHLSDLQQSIKALY